jgi:hypothetical protein
MIISHLTNPAKDAGQVIGYSHSTRPPKGDSQVAGYQGERASNIIVPKQRFSLPRRGYLAQYTPLDLLLNGGWSAVIILCHM